MASSAGTCTITEERHGSMKKIKWAFVNGSGAGASSYGSTQTTYAYNGKVQMLATIPGTSAPSASWDISIKDQSSVDVLAGAGSSRAAAASWSVAASLGAVANDKLTLSIASVGSSNSGAVYLFIR